MLDAEFYRQRADQCAELAAKSQIPEVKERLRQLASRYGEQAWSMAQDASPPLAPEDAPAEA